MFGQKEYDEYVKFQELADNSFRQGDDEMSNHWQEKANVAYETYEYAAGHKADDY